MLEKFTVIDLIKTRSNSVATVMSNGIKFNNPTAQELYYPPFIQLLINPKDKQFAIRVSKENEPNTVSFSKPEGEQKYQIKVSAPAASDMIYKMMNWNPEQNWNIPGIYFAKENCIIYDCKAAYKPVAKGGWNAVKNSIAQAEAKGKEAFEAMNDGE